MIEVLELDCEIKYVFLMQLYIIRSIIESKEGQWQSMHGLHV